MVASRSPFLRSGVGATKLRSRYRETCSGIPSYLECPLPMVRRSEMSLRRIGVHNTVQQLIATCCVAAVLNIEVVAMPFLLLANYYSISPLQKRHGKEVQTTLIGNQNERMKLVARSRPRM